MPPSSSSLFNSEDIGEKDDWTQVKDPKEKKKIQNRVAQRTYRHRMKARLSELQARLDTHERLQLQHSAACAHGAHSGNMAMATFNGDTGIPGTNSSPIGFCEPKHLPSSVAGPVAGHDATAQMLSAQSNGYRENSFDDSAKPAMYPPGTCFPSSPEGPQQPPSQQPPRLLSPPTQYQQDGRPVVMPQGFAGDCLRFQNQLLNNGLRPVQPDAIYSYRLAYSAPGIQSGTGQAEQAHDINGFHSTHGESPCFAFQNSIKDTRKAEAAESVMRGATSPPTDTMNYPSLTGALLLPEGPVAVTNPDVTGTPCPAAILVSENASLEERFSSIMEQVEAAGFENFDDLVTAYYRGTFSATSSLANEQRLSRNRRLPKVVSDVFQATRDWATWERHGFHEEILRTAEAMMIEEVAGASGSLLAHVIPLIESKDGTVRASAGETLGLKKVIQHKLPNLWALAMSLMADGRSSWQRTRSSTAVATILLLQCSGRIPNEQLLQLVGSYL